MNINPTVKLKILRKIVKIPSTSPITQFTFTLLSEIALNLLSETPLKSRHSLQLADSDEHVHQNTSFKFSLQKSEK